METVSSTSAAAVEFRDVDIIFGKSREALAMLDAGATRSEIFDKTGSVLGAAGVNLTVRRGEICVLMGLSGSGKSTLLRAVNGLNKVSRGAVEVTHQGAAVDVASCSETALREVRTTGVAMVFQHFALLPWRTVRENVGFGLELRGVTTAERKRIVDEKLAMVGLAPWGDKYAHELSGGMQQRVGLARAFATDADILLMDEPFSALDPLIRDKLQDELLELQARLHKTIIFVSHDLDEAMKLGNTIAIMQDGRIVQAGTAEDILLRPSNDYVAEFVRHVNPLNVLRGHSVMTPVGALPREGNAVVLDAGGKVHLTLDAEGRPQGVLLDGRPGQLVVADGETGLAGTDPAACDVVVAPLDLKLRAAIALRQYSGSPVVLVDQLGRLAGLCGDEEIYRGLLRSDDMVAAQ
ncbi:choline ABC transporter ATP-binding protein [Radicibacter daui]|uniref:choline ABC transporter ATP-binding protein n=1 Tax=Radicibacter daui TaxID=3064829 RepID=UPI004046A009